MPVCMFHVIMTNTKIIFAEDVDMGGDGSDSMAVYGTDPVLNIEVIRLSHSFTISVLVTCAKNLILKIYLFKFIFKVQYRTIVCLHSCESCLHRE